jgi:hypothetical protein
VAAAATALVAADLLVFPLGSSAADEGNEAYAALASAPAGRVLELPLFEPGIHFGSAYDFYGLQARRERPGGYSTLAPQAAFDFFFLRNRLSCGVWLPGDEQELQDLGVEHVAFHRGLYEQAGLPGAWFGWGGLLDHGFGPVARDGEVTLLSRGGAAELAPPVPEPPRGGPVFCEGWEERTMREREGPLWVFGAGRLLLEVAAPAETRASLWLNGERVDDATVAGAATLAGDLRGGWNAVVLEVPSLLDAEPPQGLTLTGLTRATFAIDEP